MPERASRDELGNLGYELFIMALSCLSILNLILLLPFMPPDAEQDQVILMVDALLTVIFLGDFSYRSVSAESFRAYFFRERGWLDLLGSLPLLRIFRIFRVLRVARLMRQYGFGVLLRWVTRERAQSALYVVVFLVIVVLETTAVAVLPFEAKASNANITTAGDALWWGIVTVTTVGYGDQYPVTTGGRVVGVFLLLTGVALFATFTGYLANAFLAPQKPSEPTAAEAGSAPRDVLAEIRRELARQEEESAALRERLEQVEGVL
jgi:voltage-gated potassium channel